MNLEKDDFFDYLNLFSTVVCYKNQLKKKTSADMSDWLENLILQFQKKFLNWRKF